MFSHSLRPTRTAALAGVAALGILLAGCSASPSDAPAPDDAATSGEATADEASAGDASASDDSGAGHGKIEGAVEAPEPPLHLVSIDAGGSVSLLDLLDGAETALDPVRAPEAVTTDGRYAFVADDQGVDIVDSGAWTWDHVDHFHYYRATPALPGSIAGTGVATVATGMLSTAGGTGVFFPESGEAVLLDNAALSQGEIRETLRLEVAPHDGIIAPLGTGALVSEAGAGGDVERLRAVDAEGSEVDAIACADASGTITTRLALVVGCADGAVLATSSEGATELTQVPYPEGAAPAATEFSARKGRPTVAGLGDGSGVWLLDTRERSWRWIAMPERPAAATAVDDESEHLVTLTPDGRVHVFDGSGAEVAATDPLVSDADHGGRASLTVDAQRAYVNDPATGAVHEIDYADGARVARTLEPGTAADFVVETGR
ncbi:ABC transporter [Leucobacter chromiiresistens]